MPTLSYRSVSSTRAVRDLRCTITLNIHVSAIRSRITGHHWRCCLNSSSHARGVLAGFGDLLQYFGCLFCGCGLCDVSLRNDAAAAPALIDTWHAPDLVFFQDAAAILDARLGLDGHRRTRDGVAHS